MWQDDTEHEAFNVQVRDVLSCLNGTNATAVQVMAGLSADELDILGGWPK
jgi:hypothetical protein